MPSARHLYRLVLRACKAPNLPAPVQRKAAANARELFELHRHTTDPQQLAGLADDAAAAVRVLHWLNGLPQVIWQLQVRTCACGRLARPSAPRRRAPTPPNRPQEDRAHLFKHFLQPPRRDGGGALARGPDRAGAGEDTP